MATRPYRGKFRTTCPRCPLEGIYNTSNQGKRVYRVHSCAKQIERADRAARVEAAKLYEGIKRDCQCKQANHVHGTRTAYVVDKCRCRECTAASTAKQRERNRLVAYGRFDSGRVDATPAREHVHNLMNAGIGLKRISHLAGISNATLGKLIYGVPTKNIAPRTRILQETATKVLAINPTPTALADGATVGSVGTRRRVQALACLGYSVSHVGKELGWLPGNFHTLLKRDQVTVRTAKAVRELFEQLWDQPYQPKDWHGKAAASRARNFAATHGWAPPMAWDDDEIDNPKARPKGLDDPGKGDRREATKAAFVEDIEFMIEAGDSFGEISKRMGASRDTIERRLWRHQRGDLVAALKTPSGEITGLGQRGTRSKQAA